MDTLNEHLPDGPGLPTSEPEVPRITTTTTESLDLNHGADTQTLSNPWHADNVMDFCYFCCPQCAFKSKVVTTFQNHAIDVHPESKDFFDLDSNNFLNNNDMVEDVKPFIDTQPPISASKRKGLVDQESKRQRKRKRPSYEDYFAKDENHEDIDVKPDVVTDDMDFDIRAELGDVSKLKNSEGDDEKSVQCLECGERCKNLYVLAVHMKCLHETGYDDDRQKADCPSPGCRYVGSSMSNLKTHIEDCHEGEGTLVEAKQDLDDEDLEEDEMPLSDVIPEYDCTHCQKKIRGLLRLARHIGRVHNVGNYGKRICPLCSHPAGGLKQLTKHIEKAHDEKELVVCTVCGKDVAKKSYVQHSNIHREAERNEVWKCEEEGCNYESNVRANLQSHIKHQHSSHLYKEQCDVCGKKFLYKTLLESHKAVHSKVKEHICHKCGKGFTYEATLKQHWTQVPNCDVLNSQAKQWDCDQCGDKFSKIKSYMAHYRVTHKSAPRNLQGVIELHHCDQCSEAFASKGGLNTHKKTIHEGIKLKSQPTVKETCPYCGKLVNRGTQMKEHVKSKHENDTPFKCQECTKAFGTETFLRQHIKQVHQRIKCEVCGKEVCNKVWYKRHMAKVHGIVAENAFQCDLCTAVFDTADAKSKHMMKQHA